jgi:CHAT domain-containing protein
MTDLAHVDHDEALTLASALLAAGACAVIGARWPAEDLATAPLMVMFHHFLNSGHPQPADALRTAQLWMLDGARTTLAGLPPDLANAFHFGHFLTAPHAWAAFTCQGTSAGSPI